MTYVIKIQVEINSYRDHFCWKLNTSAVLRNVFCIVSYTFHMALVLKFHLFCSVEFHNPESKYFRSGWMYWTLHNCGSWNVGLQRPLPSKKSLALFVHHLVHCSEVLFLWIKVWDSNIFSCNPQLPHWLLLLVIWKKKQCQAQNCFNLALSNINIIIIQGVFFNWAHPKFAKCRPVSNRFQKNDRVPDWPPLWSENA